MRDQLKACDERAQDLFCQMQYQSQPTTEENNMIKLLTFKQYIQDWQPSTGKETHDAFNQDQQAAGTKALGSSQHQEPFGIQHQQSKSVAGKQ
jgi:hypothetical protein